MRTVESSVALAIAIVAVSGAFTTLAHDYCNSLDCSGCQTITYPLDQCLDTGFDKFTCTLTNQLCMALQEFPKSATCDGTPGGLSKAICDQCTDFGTVNSVAFAVVRGCRGDSATFAYDCDVTCSTCKKSLPLTVGKCVMNPINQMYYKPIGSALCPPLVGLQYWTAPGNCSTAPNQNATSPSLTCFNDYAQNLSTRLICK